MKCTLKKQTIFKRKQDQVSLTCLHSTQTKNHDQPHSFLFETWFQVSTYIIMLPAVVQIQELSCNILIDTNEPLENTISRLNLISTAFGGTECCLSSEGSRVWPRTLLTQG